MGNLEVKNLMNLLFIAEDTSNFIDKSIHFLEKELANLTNLIVWRHSGRIENILNNTFNKPDFILIVNDMGFRMTPVLKGLHSIDIPTALIVNDLHRFTESRRHYIRKNNINYIFSIIRDKFHENYPEYKNKMIWLPHSINNKIYKDYHLIKDISLLMMGAVNESYPLRQKILKTYKGNLELVYHEHPGYQSINKLKRDSLYIDEKYAKEINRAKIFFTCPSIYSYPIMKYYEALACRSLLLAPTFKELEDIGFLPGVHFVDINESNFKEKATYYLNNEHERRKIMDEGYKFIHQNHTVQIRARQLVERIKQIIS